MSFMKPQIVYDRWFEIDYDNGIAYIPQDLIGKTVNPSFDEVKDYLPDLKVLFDVRLLDGYGARLSAPGYMDCTEWSVFDTKEEAQDYLSEMYADDDDELENLIKAL